MAAGTDHAAKIQRVLARANPRWGLFGLGGTNWWRVLAIVLECLVIAGVIPPGLIPGTAGALTASDAEAIASEYPRP